MKKQINNTFSYIYYTNAYVMMHYNFSVYDVLINRYQDAVFHLTL